MRKLDAGEVVKVGVMLTPGQRDRLQTAANLLNLSMSAYMIMLLEAAVSAQSVDKNEKKKKRAA